MVALNCPLCCNETFTSAASLKSHLIDILENILCPICHERFDKLDKLLEHLEDDCSIKESILAKALLRSPKKEEESEYYCQMCDSHFDDIDEHLKKFHEGQEIIVEEACTDAGNESTDPTVIILNTNEEDSQQSPTDENSPSPVSEVDIKDKDGRLYTRKFVKIDKFWLQDTQDKPIETPISPTSNIKYVEYSKCQFCKSYLPAVHLSTHECPSESRPKIKTIKVHLCEICKTTFPTFKSLRLHRRMHEPIKKQKIEAPANYEEGEEPLREMFICTICNKTYDKEYEEVHMHSHQFNSEFNCEICNRKFFTKTNLEMHMKAHTNNKKFACSYCKKPFVTYDALNNHVLTECQKRAYVCNYCGRRFTRPHEKVKHERIHTGEKPHVCEVCGKAFRVSYCLTLHLRTHSGTRPYQCKHCGKRFKSHSVYNHHLLTHSDVRAYKCPYCPKAFKTSVQLAGHKNSHIKPFTCTDCNRPFASLYAVRAHMETHKRVNNLKYECWMCGALYSRAFALRDHLKQQHQQVEGEKVKAEVVTVSVDEEMEAANSILVNEDDDIILGLDRASNIEIMENEGE